jgi:hypothetical protein
MPQRQPAAIGVIRRGRHVLNLALLRPDKKAPLEGGLGTGRRRARVALEVIERVVVASARDIALAEVRSKIHV